VTSQPSAGQQPKRELKMWHVIAVGTFVVLLIVVLVVRSQLNDRPSDSAWTCSRWTSETSTNRHTWAGERLASLRQADKLHPPDAGHVDDYVGLVTAACDRLGNDDLDAAAQLAYQATSRRP
jgi:hypothetical protein